MLYPLTNSVSYSLIHKINQIITLFIMQDIGAQISMGSHHLPHDGGQPHAFQSNFCIIQFKRAFLLHKRPHEYISDAYSSQFDFTRRDKPPMERYRREIALPRLIPVGPAEVSDCSIAGRTAIVQRLMRSLRGERVRGRAGHWSYDLNRHVGLVEALKHERQALRQLTRAAASLAVAAGVPRDCGPVTHGIAGRENKKAAPERDGFL